MPLTETQQKFIELEKKKAEIINPTNDVKCKCKKIMTTTAT